MMNTRLKGPPAGTRSRQVVSVCTFHGAGVPVVKVGGEIDIATAPLLERHLSATITPCDPDVVVDVRGLAFIDASGLAVLVRADNRARLHGGRLQLAGVSDRLTRLLRVTRLDKRFGPA